MTSAKIVLRVAAVLLLGLLVVPSSQQTVSLLTTQNVTKDGALLLDAEARALDLGPRTLVTSTSGGRRGIATTALGTDVVTNTPSVVLGAAYTKAVNETCPHLPICVISYFVQTPGQCFFVPDPPIDNWSTLFARNTIGSFPYAFDEVDSKNNTVLRFNFAEQAWPRTNLSASAKDANSLAVFEWVTNITDTSNVTVAFVESSRLGVLSLDETPALPKAWEVIVRINNYSYASPGNRLKLEYMMATGFGVNRRTPGLIVLPRANSTLFDQAYCQMSNHTTIGEFNGTWVDVQPTTFNLVTTLNPVTLVPILDEQLTLEYGTFGIWRSNVTFPADAAWITYQVRTGIGEPIVAGSAASSNTTTSNTNTNSAPTARPEPIAVALTLLVVVAFLLL